MAEPLSGPEGDSIEVVPVVVLSQIFPARPSSIPDIRDFVRRCLAESPLTEEGTREVGETVFRALLDAAGPTGSIQVAFRIFPEHVEVDVLHSEMPIAAPFPGAGSAGRRPRPADRPGRAMLPGSRDRRRPTQLGLRPGRAAIRPGGSAARRARPARRPSRSGCRARCAGRA